MCAHVSSVVCHVLLTGSLSIALSDAVPDLCQLTNNLQTPDKRGQRQARMSRMHRCTYRGANTGTELALHVPPSPSAIHHEPAVSQRSPGICPHLEGGPRARLDCEKRTFAVCRSRQPQQSTTHNKAKHQQRVRNCPVMCARVRRRAECKSIAGVAHGMARQCNSRIRVHLHAQSFAFTHVKWSVSSNLSGTTGASKCACSSCAEAAFFAEVGCAMPLTVPVGTGPAAAPLTAAIAIAG